MIRLPFTAVQAGYTTEQTSGVMAIPLPGGNARSRLDIRGPSRAVTATYVLSRDAHDLFLAYVRKWERSGGQNMLMPLAIDRSAVEDYEASFVPGSPPRTVTDDGAVKTISVNLTVMTKPVYLDATTDPVGLLIDWNDATYGDIDIGGEVLLSFESVVRRLPRE